MFKNGPIISIVMFKYGVIAPDNLKASIFFEKYKFLKNEQANIRRSFFRDLNASRQSRSQCSLR